VNPPPPSDAAGHPAQARLAETGHPAGASRGAQAFGGLARFTGTVARGKWARLIAGVVAVGIAVAAVLLPGPRSGLAGLSVDTLFWLRDEAFGQRRPASASPVAVIVIDEATYNTPPFQGLSKELWTPQFAAIIRAVNQAGPHAIGMDIVLPTSMEGVQRGYERDFRRALKEAGDAGRMVMAKVQAQGPPLLPVREHILAAGGMGNVRSVNLPQDSDGIVRHAPLTFPRSGGGTEPGFALELARRAKPDLAVPAGEQFPVNFDGGLPFLTFSLADIFACAQAGDTAFFEAQFKDRVVLLATGLDVEDRLITSRRYINRGEELTGPRCSPAPAQAIRHEQFARATMPGVFVHAAAIDNLLRNEILQRPLGIARVVLVASSAAMAAAPALLMPLGWAAGALLGVLLGVTALATVLVHNGLALPLVESLGAALLAFALLLAFRFAVSDRDKRRIHHMFGMYLAPTVIDRMISSGNLPALGGERRSVTLLFSDIANFTTLAESADPAKLLPALNAYLDGVCNMVMEEGGLVMDFAGDGVLALFGAPADLPDHAARSVAAARKIFAFTEAFRAEQAAAGLRFGHTRIGLNTGEAMVGNFGSSKRLKYTAMGDVVNVASRLEGLNKYTDSRICMSEDTRLASGDTAIRPMGRFRLKGKLQGIPVYQILPAEQADLPFMARYRDAYAALERGDPEAKALFEALAQEDPTDGCTHFHLERLRAGILTPDVVMEDK